MTYTLPDFKLEKSNIEIFYPLSPLQWAMISKSLQSPEQGMYIVQACYDIRGALDIECFKQAWQTVIQRHPILRTLFSRFESDKPLQVVCKQVPLPWISVDLSDHQDSEAACAQWIEQDRLVDFDFARPALMRLILLDLGQGHYRFVWSHHHCISDGWSMPVVVNEVLSVYQAKAQHLDIELGPKADYQAMINWLGQQDKATSLAWWQDHLASLSSRSELKQANVDSRAIDQGSLGSLGSQRVSVPLEFDATFDQALTQRIETFCQAQSITPNILMSGLFGLTLSFYLDTPECVFGSVTGGRDAPIANIDKMVGPCLNTVAVKMTLDRALKVSDWLAEVMTTQVQRTSHEYLSLLEIAEQLNPELRDGLFNCLYVYENYPHTASIGDEADSQSISQSISQNVSQSNELMFQAVQTKEANSVPFSFLVAPGEETLVRIAIDSSQFELGFAQQFFADYQALLHQILDNPQQSLAELKLRPSPPISSALTLMPMAASDLVEGFAMMAEQYPQRIALSDPDQQLTYAQLARITDLLAEQLLQNAVKPGDRVAILLAPGYRQMLAMLAVLKVGGCYVPLDINNPDSRNGFIIEDAAVNCIITDQPSIGFEHQAVILTMSWQDHDQAVTLPSLALADSLAYIIYTSGTTGKPKGVMINHNHVIRLFASAQQGYGFTVEDKWILLHSFAFDVSVWEMWGAFLFGAHLYIPHQDHTRDFNQLCEVLHRQQITVLNQTPSAFYQLANALCLRPDKLTSLHTVIFAGEKLNTALLKEWSQRYDVNEVKLVNMYGITEITVHGMYHQVTLADINGGHSRIGQPLADLSMRLMGNRGSEVPQGCIGEIWVSGPGVSIGYLNRAELTAEKFVQYQGQTWYRSGDLAYANRQQQLVYVSRMDNQVQIRGFRVELGEIEQSLSLLDKIEQCLVTTIPSVSGDDILLAFVVDGLSRSSQQLTELIRDQLPHYMLPNRIVVLDEFPMTVNGKVDSRALLAIHAANNAATSSSAGQVTSTLTSTLTSTEAAIAAIWQNILQQPVTDAAANFFELGGHSLLATQLIYAYKKQHQVEIPVQAVFDHPELATLARFVDQLANQAEQQPIPQAEQRQSAPLSFSQQRLWFLSQISGAEAAYNLPLAMDIRGQLNLTAVDLAVTALVRRHEGLRAGFKLVDGQAQQFIREPIEPLQRINAVNWTEEQLQQAIDQTCQTPFDLATDALYRISVFECQPGRHILLLVLHHIVTDGWSNGIIQRDFSLLYQHYDRQAALALPTLPVQYFDYALWQRSQHSEQQYQQQLDYWQQKLHGMAAIMPLPLDFPRAQDQFVGNNISLSLAQSSVDKLEQLARSTQTTLFMVLLSAFKTMLAQFCGTADVAVGTVLANRQRQELEDVVGFFTNTLVIRSTMDNHQPFSKALQQTRKTLLDAYQHQDIPFDQVVDAVCQQRSDNAAALVQVMFVLQNAQQSKGAQSAIEGLDIRPVDWQYGQSKFDMTLSLQQDSQGLHIHLEYKVGLFSGQRMQQWLSAYCQALDTIAEQPQLPGVALFTAADTGSTIAATDSHELQTGLKTRLAELAEQHPERVAVMAGSQVSYQALHVFLNTQGASLPPLTSPAISALLTVLQQWWQNQHAIVSDSEWSEGYRAFVMAPLQQFIAQQYIAQQLIAQSADIPAQLWLKSADRWWGLDESQLTGQIVQAALLLSPTAKVSLNSEVVAGDTLLMLLTTLYCGATVVGSGVSSDAGVQLQAEDYRYHPVCGFWAHQGQVIELPGVTVSAQDRLGFPLPAGAIGQLVCHHSSAVMSVGVLSGDDTLNKGVAALGQTGQVTLSGRLEVDIDQSAGAVLEGRFIDGHEIAAFLLLTLPLKALTVAFRRTSSGTCGVIYMVAANGQSEAVKMALLEQLPAVWQRQHIIELAAMALTAEGHTDVKALQALPLVSDQQLALWNQAASGNLSKGPAKASRPSCDLPPLTAFMPAQPQSPQSVAVLHGETLLELRPQIQLLRDCLMYAAGQPGGGVDFITKTAYTPCSYQQLLDQASQVAGGLIARGLAPGQRLIFVLPDNQAFCTLFWACQLIGVIPVFCEWPDGVERQRGALQKLQHVRQLLPEALIVSVESILSAVSEQIPATAMVDFQSLLSGAAIAVNQWPEIDSQANAVLLLTSGSTGKPKLVPQTHQAILARTRATSAHNALVPEDISFNWMPLDHVGAIVMFHVCDTFMAVHQIHANTQLILQQPLRWLDIMTEHRVTVTWAPNFAYQLINDKLQHQPDKPWDLSALRFILNAGEAIQPKTTQLFMSNLAACGLDSSAMKPCWGMSETCSGVVYNHRYDGRFADASAEFMVVGWPIAGFSVRIVNPDGSPCLTGQTGALQVKGTNVLRGYLLNDAENQQSFTADGWFDTGDLAKITEQGLLITGRQKEQIIINGVNYSCHEIESAVAHSGLVEASYSAACPVVLADKQEASALFVVATDEQQRSQVAAQLRQLVFEQTQLGLDFILFLQPHQVPKSNIGKILRARLQQQFAAQAFTEQTVSFVGHSHDNQTPLWFAQPTLIAAPAPAVNFQSSAVIHLGKPAITMTDEQVVIPLDENLSQRVVEQLLSLAAVTVRLVLWWPSTSGNSTAYRHLLSLVSDCHQALPLLQVRLWAFSDQQVDGLQGCLASISKEYPLWQTSLISVDDSDPDWSAIANTELVSVGHQANIRYLNGQRYQLKLSQPRVTGPLPDPGQLPFVGLKNATYLIYGGLSDMVRPLINFMLQHYQARVILVGRRSVADVDTQLGQFYAPARVQYYQADLSVAGEADKLFAALPSDWRDDLAGCIHAAGQYQECEINAITEAHWQASVAAKMQGLDNLLQAARHYLPNDGLVVQFASVNGYFGGSGVAAYATANSYQQQMSRRLNQQSGLKSYCVLFSAWQDTGMSKQVTSLAASAANGFDVMAPEPAFRSLLWCLSQPAGEWLVGVNPAHPALAYEGLAYEGLGGTVALYSVRQNAAEAALEGKDESGRLCSFSKAAAQAMTSGTTELSTTEQQLVHCWQASLDHHEFSLDDNYFAVGGNSIRLVQLREQINSQCTQPVELTELFKYPTIRALAQFIDDGSDSSSKVPLKTHSSKQSLQSNADKRRSRLAKRQGKNRK